MITQSETQLSSLIFPDYPLSDLVFYKAGGTAAYVAFPSQEDELQWVLAEANKLGFPVVVLGHGSNTLFAEGRHEIFVICMSEYDTSIVHSAENQTIYAGSGVLLDSVVARSVYLGYSQMVTMSGIPGGVGGGAMMNAGAFGSEFKDTAVSVKILDIPLGKVGVIDVDDDTFAYRSSGFGSRTIILGVWFRFNERSDAGGLVSQELQKERKGILAKREGNQPLKYPSCGSVFKRPEGHYAGKLISDAGLKGFVINGAQVSTKHANFILNTGNATATDIYNVIQHVKGAVLKNTGVMLQTEVKLIGFD